MEQGYFRASSEGTLRRSEKGGGILGACCGQNLLGYHGSHYFCNSVAWFSHCQYSTLPFPCSFPSIKFSLSALQRIRVSQLVFVGPGEEGSSYVSVWIKTTSSSDRDNAPLTGWMSGNMASHAFAISVDSLRRSSTVQARPRRVQRTVWPRMISSCSVSVHGAGFLFVLAAGMDICRPVKTYALSHLG